MMALPGQASAFRIQALGMELLGVVQHREKPLCSHIHSDSRMFLLHYRLI
jgi:hypothetical protein